jgi:hypothetical protein
MPSSRFESVVIETARHRVQGKVRVPAEGYRNRLSDRLMDPGRGFILVEDATVTTRDSGGEREYPVVMVSRDSIELLIPLDEGPSA